MHKRSILILTSAVALALGGAASAHPGLHCPGGRHMTTRASVSRHWAHHRGGRWGGHFSQTRVYGEDSGAYRRRDGLYRQEQSSVHHEEHAWSHEEGGGWSHEERGAWGYEGGERWSPFDEYGYLTWPGKAHFGPQPAGEPPVGGPPMEEPPVGAPPPPRGDGRLGPPAHFETPDDRGPPPQDGYELRRF